MDHMHNSMIVDVSTSSENVWYVDSSALNHMTHCGEWFKEMHTVKTLVMYKLETKQHMILPT